MGAWESLGLACACIAGSLFWGFLLSWANEVTRESSLEKVIEELRQQSEARKHRQQEIADSR